MSFTTNTRAEGATPPAVMLRAGVRASVPASRAQLGRSLRLYPWLALSVGCLATCLVAGGLTGYALRVWASDLKWLALLAVALPLGAICGMLAALLRHRLAAKIYGEGDIEELTGLPPLAILPARGEVASGAYEAHLLRLAGAIAGANRSRGAKAFLLTAVSAGTNIEPLVSALQRKFEETGFQVAVAAAGDLLRPVAEGCSGGFVAANLARLTGEEFLVLVQAGPLLHSAETEFVAHSVDATILVVECAVTTRQELWRAAVQLERMQVMGVGAVLEELPMRLADAAYRTAMEAEEKAPAFRRAVAASFESASDLVQDEVSSAVEEREQTLLSDSAQQRIEESSPGPVLVDRPVEFFPPTEEKGEQQALHSAGNGFLHEKIAPELSVRRQAPESNGEPGMKRRMGWLGRLLGRDAQPTSILPADDEEYEVRAAAGGTTRTAAEEDYSVPLATRLDQISRQRPAAPFSSSRSSTRLQIVPQDAPREIFVPSTRSAVEDGREENSFKELGAPEFPSVAALGAETPSAEGAKPEMAATSEVADRVTFFEAEAEPEHFETGEFETAQFASGSEEIHSPFEEPVRSRRELLAQQQREWEFGQESEAEHEEPDSGRPVSAEEPPATQSGLHEGYEVLAFVPELRTPSEIAWRTHWQVPAHLAEEPAAEAVEAEPVAQPLAADTAQSAAPDRVPDPLPAPEAELVADGFPAQYEADDIEPVYEEVSRHLLSGRWDPIPTLRPDSNGWRDRPSPMPPSNTERLRWTGEDQDLEAWRSGPPSGSGPRMESLPEPLLTRQWGLLSKFQQARLSSGSRPVARTEEDEAVSTNGKGRV